MKFEKAVRLKLRFETNKGKVTTEDLWDIPLICVSGFSLDEIAKSLNRDRKQSEEESFVIEKSAVSELIELKFSIVKHIIQVKLEEKSNAQNAILAKAKKAKIMEILEGKEDKALEKKSVADLKKMLEEL